MTTTIVRQSNGYRLVKDISSNMYVIDTDEEVGLWMDVYEAKPMIEALNDEEFEELAKEYV